MNCESNQLAYVACGFPATNRGRVLRVTTIDADLSFFFGTPMWNYEGHIDGYMGGRAHAVDDRCLRPLGNPGKDEVDQTLIYTGDPRVRNAEVSHD